MASHRGLFTCLMRPDSHCRVISVGCGRRQQTRTESPRSSPYHNRLQPGDQLTQAGLQAALVPLHFLQRSVFQYLEFIQDAAWIMVTSTPSPHPFWSAEQLRCQDPEEPKTTPNIHWSHTDPLVCCLLWGTTVSFDQSTKGSPRFSTLWARIWASILL